MNILSLSTSTDSARILLPIMAAEAYNDQLTF